MLRFCFKITGVKISIITVTYNSAKTVQDTLDSVKSQTYPNIEHIVIDGGSTDETVNILRKASHLAKWISEPDEGLYDAINKGICLATGDVIGLLHSDDFFPHVGVIANLQAAFDNSDIDAVYGDVVFVQRENPKKVVRYYSSQGFTPAKFKYGYMPAHPSFYVKKVCFEKFGLYHTDYQIAADYELLMRLIYREQIPCSYLEKVIVCMREGGISNTTLKSRYILNQEIIKARASNGVKTTMFLLCLKYFKKIFEYLNPSDTHAQ